MMEVQNFNFNWVRIEQDCQNPLRLPTLTHVDQFRKERDAASIDC